MPVVFIGVGSNLGDRKGFFRFAEQKLRRDPAIRDLECSPVYETEPVDGAGQPLYWNAVWSCETELAPRDLLQKLQEIERKAGRERKVPNEARVLDLDILFYGDEIMDQEALTVPHPRLTKRTFVLVPFCDLAPEFMHPGTGRTVQQLLDVCRRKADGLAGIKKLSE